MKTNTCGLIGLICSIIGFFIFGWILSIAAVILGIIGLNQENSSKALPTIALIIGVIEIFILSVAMYV